MNSLEALVELEKLLDQMMRTPHGRRTFLTAVPLLLTACGPAKRTRYREGDNTGQQTSLTVEDEMRMTKEILPKMQKDYPPVKDQAMQKYIRNLGDEIVQANKLHKNPYTYNFTVVGVAYVNAFALPAGTIFVTAPLINMAESEAELAGVVGHEIGHVKARHTAERIDAAKRNRKKTIWSVLGGGAAGAAAGFGLGKLLCPPKDDACVARAAGLGAAAGAGAGLLISRYAFMANSREDELEADRIGFRTSVAAGYSKEHVGDFYEKLLVMEQKYKKSGAPVFASVADAMSTHPPSKERVQQMNEMEASASQVKGKVSSKQFKVAKSKAHGWTKAHPPKRR